MNNLILHPFLFFLSLGWAFFAALFSGQILFHFYQEKKVLREEHRLLSLLREEKSPVIDLFLNKISSLQLCNHEKNTLYQLKKMNCLNEKGEKRLSFLENQKISFFFDKDSWKIKKPLQIEQEDLEKIVEIFTDYPSLKISTLKLEKIGDPTQEHEIIQCILEFQNL